MNSDLVERIMSMKFDNQQFQSGIKETSESLDEFEEKLKFDDAGKGLSKLKQSFDDVFGGIEYTAMSTVDRIKNVLIDRFAVDLYSWGKNFARSLSLDQVTAGFSKFEEQTKSSFTIMAATGKSVEEVDAALERLAWFSDETSYSFTDMVDNVGKFTSQKIDLDTSIKAMQGIATAAALAGQGTGEASRAMYNFSQSLAQGSVKLMDWKSIENANMATAQFKQTIIETAKEAGTLNKESKTKKGTLVNEGTFSATLSEGWFTSEVLLKSLEKYGGYADKLYEYINTHDVDTASQAMREMGDAGDELGQKAFRAAQEARTFNDAINATTDAVSSGWMQSFKLIIGNTDQATTLFTDMANALWDVFASGGEARNELLKGWNELGGREKLLKGIYNALEGIWNIITTVKEALLSAFPNVTVERLLNLTEKVEAFGTKLKDTFGILTKIRKYHQETTEEIRKNDWDFGEKIEQGMRGDKVKKMQEELIELGYDVGDSQADGVFGPKTQKALEQFQKEYKLTVSGVYDEATHFTIGKALWGTEYKDSLKEFTEETEEKTPALQRLSNVFQSLSYVGRLAAEGFIFVKDALSKVFGVFKPIADVAIEIAEKFFLLLGNWANDTIKSGIFYKWLHKLDQGLVPVSEKIEAFAESIRKFLGLDQDFESFSEWWEHIKSSFLGLFSGGEESAEPNSTFVDRISGIIEKIKALWAQFTGGFGEEGSTVADKITGLFTSIAGIFSGGEAQSAADGAEEAGTLIDKISGVISKITGALGEANIGGIALTIGKVVMGFKAFSGLADLFRIGSTLKSGISDITDAAKTAIENFGGIGEAIQDRIKGVKPETTADAIRKIATSIALIAGSLYVVANLDAGKALIAAGILLGMMGVIVALVLIMNHLKITPDARASTMFMTIATTIFMISVSLKMLADLDTDSLLKGVAGIGSILLMLAAFVVATNGLQAGTHGLLVLAVSVGILGLVIKMLGSMDPLDALQGVLVLTVIFAELFVFMKLTNRLRAGTTLGRMLGLVIFLGVAAQVVKMLGEMHPLDALQGVVALGLVMSELAFFMIITDKLRPGSGLVKMLGLSLFIYVAATVIEAIGAMDPLRALQGVAALGAVLLELAVFVIMTDKLKMSSSLIQMIGLSIFIATAASVIKTIGDMDPISALQGVVALGAIMAELVIFMRLSGGLRVKLGSMFALVAFLKAATEVVERLGSLSIRGAVQGVAALGVVLTELALFVHVVNGIKVTTGLFSMLGISAFVLAAAYVVHLLGHMNPLRALQGVIMLGAIMTELGIFMILVNGTKPHVGIQNMVATVIFLGAAVGAIAILSSLDSEKAFDSAVILGMIMAELAAAVIVINSIKVTKISVKAMVMISLISGLMILIAAGLAIAASKLDGINPIVLTALSLAISQIMGSMVAIAGLSILSSKLHVNPAQLMKGSLAIAASFTVIIAMATALLVGLGELNKLGKGNFLINNIRTGGKILKELASALDVFNDPLTTISVMAAMLAGFTIVGWTGPGKPIAGAASITAAFGIAAGVSTAVLTGMGYLDDAIKQAEGKDSTGLVGKIKTGGDALREVADALNVLDLATPIDQIGYLAGILATFEIVGWTGPLKPIVGSAAVSGAFAVAGTIALGYVAGLGLLSQALTDNSISDTSALVQAIRDGGTVLSELGDALMMFNFDTPMEAIMAADSMIAAWTVAGWVGGLKTIVGATAVSAAFTIATDIAIAVIGGLGVLNNFGKDGYTGQGGLEKALNEGGKVLGSVGEAFGSFVGGFEKMKAAVTGVPLEGSEEGKTQTFNAFFKSVGELGEDEGLEGSSELDAAIDAVDKVANFVDKLGGYEHIMLGTEQLDTLFRVTGGDKKAAEDFINKSSGITAFDTVVQAVGLAAETFSTYQYYFENLDFFTTGSNNDTKLTGILNVMTRVADFMNALSGDEYKSLEKATARTRTIFGFGGAELFKFFGSGSQMTSFETVLQGLGDTIDTFSELTKENVFGDSKWSKIDKFNVDEKDVNSDINKLQSILDMMLPIADFMNKLGGDKYANIEHLPGGLPAVWKDATAFDTVIQGVSSIVTAFSSLKSVSTFGADVTSVNFKTKSMATMFAEMPIFYSEYDEATKKFTGVDGMRMSGILGIMEQVATFMEFVSGLNIEHDAGWWGQIFGEKTAFTTVLNGVSNAVDTFQEIKGKLEEAAIDTDTVSRFNNIISMMNRVVGVMRNLNSIKTELSSDGSGYTLSGSLQWADLMGFLESLRYRIEDMDAIVDSGNYDKYIESMTKVSDIYNSLATLATTIDTPETANSVGTAVAGALSAVSTEAATAGADIGNTLLKYLEALPEVLGSEYAIGLVENAVSPIGSAAVANLNSRYSDFKRSGEYAAEGYARGLGNSRAAKDAARKLATDAWNELKNANMEGSPSKLYERSGMFATLGFANGLTKYSDVASRAADGMANGSLQTVQNSIAAVSTALAEGVDSAPTIRPVLDLTDIANGASTMNGLFQDPSLDVTTSSRIAKRVAENSGKQTSVSGGNSDVVSAIQSLRDDFDSLIGAMSNLQVVTETGALVAAIGPKMDQYLGRKAMKERRRGI